jgi:hypothetical protein
MLKRSRWNEFTVFLWGGGGGQNTHRLLKVDHFCTWSLLLNDVMVTEKSGGAGPFCKAQ